MTSEEKTLRIFVYGTLKRGESNHPLMVGHSEVWNAWTVGDLYDLGSFPMLNVTRARHRILALSHKDPQEDLQNQDEFSEKFGDKKKKLRLAKIVAGNPVYGDLVVFKGSEAFLAEVLERLDGLEGFQGNALYDMYKRALVPVETLDGVTAAWTYIKGDNFSLDGASLLGSIWRKYGKARKRSM
jgi:gamma-glutamylcyclotransferase (GGCT)/AIG2-like uncharacterized protein YtfP